MSSTVKLTSVRFVKRVSNGASLSKYGYIGMMQSNADAIIAAPWIMSSSLQSYITLTTNQITKTDGVFNDETASWTTKPTYTAYMADIYDCFAQAGDAVARNATICGYAGCVAYRFKLPTSASANALQSIELSLQRDRYLRAGVRIGLQLSNSDTPSEVWSVIRGEDQGCVRSQSTSPGQDIVGVSSFGFLGQPDTPNLVASQSAAGTITFDTSTAFSDAMSYAYLWCYITLEDPAAYWNMYSETAKRQYYIEGSAMLIADGCSFTFESAPATQTSTGIIVRTFGSFSLNYSPSPTDGMSDYRIHPCVASDWFAASRDGSPMCGIINGDNGSVFSPEMDPDNPNLSPNSDYVSSDPRCGLISCYSALLDDRLVRCDMSGQLSLRNSAKAGFSVGIGTNYTISDGTYTITGGPCFIARKKLLVPFSLPLSFTAKSIDLYWTRDVYFKGPENFMVRCNVWIRRGGGLNYSDASLQRHELWTAESTSVDEWTLVDSFLADPKSSGERNSRRLPYDVGSGLHTLLFTVFFDQDSITFESDGTPSIPLIGSGFTNITLSTQGFLKYHGAFDGGWDPRVTLKS